MTRLVLRPLARADVFEIADLYVQYSQPSAEKIMRELDQAFEHIVSFPKMGKDYAHIRAGLRGYIMRDYIIFYAETSSAIEVVRVLHGASDLSDIAL